MAFIFLFLTVLSMIISSSIQVAANAIISLFFYGRVIFHCMYVQHLLCSFLRRWTFSCFHVLAGANSATVNPKVHVSFWNFTLVWMYAQEWDCWVVW